jgi:hypothetical protein
LRSLLWKQNAVNTALADPEIIATKNMHAKSQKIDVNLSKNENDVKVVVNSKSKKIAIQVSI